MIIEHGQNIFINGCPVCKLVCCCADKSSSCTRMHHCYKKCPRTKVAGLNKSINGSIDSPPSQLRGRSSPSANDDERQLIDFMKMSKADKIRHLQNRVANGESIIPRNSRNCFKRKVSGFTSQPSMGLLLQGLEHRQMDQMDQMFNPEPMLTPPDSYTPLLPSVFPRSPTLSSRGLFWPFDNVDDLIVGEESEDDLCCDDQLPVSATMRLLDNINKASGPSPPLKKSRLDDLPDLDIDVDMDFFDALSPDFSAGKSEKEGAPSDLLAWVDASDLISEPSSTSGASNPTVASPSDCTTPVRLATTSNCQLNMDERYFRVWS